jgi:hypothetical protein
LNKHQNQNEYLLINLNLTPYEYTNKDYNENNLILVKYKIEFIVNTQWIYF